ncbi:MAG: branched-chain amino acid ABC transporter permease [Alphaproteobacteria bacterium]|nr:branched-chain amino acid ABC transporter permease [Alphaproteobacteria bacterium]
MLYRETGQFKTDYEADQQIFPIRQDRWLVALFLAVAVLFVPTVINDYWAKAVLLPFLVYAMAALGLNILVGYCGQISLGTGGFMAVGAFASFKLMTAFPDMNLIVVLLLSGCVTAAVGVLFGLPSLRIKGFYLAVATLAAQFFLVWLFNKLGWFYNYNATGQITVPPREVFGFLVTGPEAKPAVTYLFTLGFVVVFALVAKNVVRGRIGRMWMAIRDMDIAAELIGVRPLHAKLSAFAFSSFYIGVAGGLIFTIYLGAVEVTEAFGIDRSFLVLFMVIIGGLGSIVGSFLGAAFLVLMPILLKNFMVDWLGMAAVTAKHMEITLMGVLIIFFLIVEPHGFARLWQILKEKLRLWPFPY